MGFGELVAVSIGDEAADVVTLAVEVTLFASFGFLGTVLALRSSRDDFAFIIPYVRFRQDAVTGQPVVLDPETIADGRVAADRALGVPGRASGGSPVRTGRVAGAGQVDGGGREESR